MALHPHLAAQLLRWYARHRRDLPWRRTRNPYRIWVSEVMLQQTRAEVVIPYYHAFLRAFPTLQALAAARLDDVLGLWAGLGYYARARHLHAAARQIVRRGRFPTTSAEWQKLPGVGPYTAAAVASIAFGEDAVALDGNVARVGLRLLGLRASLSDSTARRAVEAALRLVLPRGRAGQFNQALMDLGATVCVPKNPRCEACPVCSLCRARQNGTASLIPLPKARTPKPVRHFVAALLRDTQGRVLLVRQPPHGLWGSLWTLPFVEASSWEQAQPALQHLLGVPLRRDGLHTTLWHTFTHFRARFHVFRVQSPKAPRAGRFASTPPARVALPTPFRKLLSSPPPAGRSRPSGERL